MESSVNLHTAVPEHRMRHERKVFGLVSYYYFAAIHDSRSTDHCSEASHDLDCKLIRYESELRSKYSATLT